MGVIGNLCNSYTNYFIFASKYNLIPQFMINSKIFAKSALLVFLSLLSTGLLAQEEKKHFSTGADFVSSYIWRGTLYGTGPHIQPSLEFNAGPLTLGGWASVDFAGYNEADLYFSLALPAGFKLGMTDYYYPGLNYFDVTKINGSHAFEINAAFSKGGLSLAANCILNEAGNAGSAGGDMYFEASYAFESMSLILGAGDGWHTGNGKFNVCNIGIGTSKEIKITDSFNIPVSGQVIINPHREKLYIVVGFSF
jgi:hypothetical protein